jgi:hypothetical protein
MMLICTQSNETATANKGTKTMTITITVISETGNKVAFFTFNNSIDANKERDLFDAAGINYTVHYDCR